MRCGGGGTAGGLTQGIPATGLLDLGRVLDDAEVGTYQRLFEANRAQHKAWWRRVYAFQHANYDAVFTQNEWDALVRHPKILPLVEALMGAGVCLGENSLREMAPTGLDHAGHQDWQCARPTHAPTPATLFCC